MQYFMDTVDTIPPGVGFRFFGVLHLLWLVLFASILLVCVIWYRRLSIKGKTLWRKTIAILLLVDELYKVIMLVIGKRYLFDYLPLHLCSINIFLISYHAWRPNQLLGGYLYTVGIPAATAALLFPSWASLPLMNFMHIHSFTVHILLAVYPITLGLSGEFNLKVKEIYKYLLLLICMAIPIYFLNLILDTNFMFLMYAEEGNPLYLFEELWGNHLYGFPVIITAVLVIMYLPLVLWRRYKAKK